MSHSMMTVAKQRFHQVWKLYAYLFIPMWLMFGLNATILFDGWNSLGVKPRELSISSLIGVFTSWTMHGNLNHIIGNTMVMAQILFLFGIFERQAFRTIILLIIASGLLTWLFGSANSNHIGASGLAFAMMGYMIGGALFAKRWGYLVASIALGTGFWVAMFQGLVPQMGISFAGHFGGLLAGLLYGADSEKRTHQLSLSNQ